MNPYWLGRRSFSLVGPQGIVDGPKKPDCDDQIAANQQFPKISHEIIADALSADVNDASCMSLTN